MRSKVPDCAKPKMGKLVEPMTLLEWWIFFLKAKEGKSYRVIRGPHHGIYKSCTTDKDKAIVMMYTTIVFITFKLGRTGSIDGTRQ